MHAGGPVPAWSGARRIVSPLTRSDAVLVMWNDRGAFAVAGPQYEHYTKDRIEQKLNEVFPDLSVDYVLKD